MFCVYDEMSDYTYLIICRKTLVIGSPACLAKSSPLLTTILVATIAYHRWMVVVVDAYIYIAPLIV